MEESNILEPVIEQVKNGFIVKIGRKTTLPGIYLTEFEAERAAEKHKGAARAAALESARKYAERRKKED